MAGNLGFFARWCVERESQREGLCECHIVQRDALKQVMMDDLVFDRDY